MLKPTQARRLLGKIKTQSADTMNKIGRLAQSGNMRAADEERKNMTDLNKLSKNIKHGNVSIG